MDELERTLRYIEKDMIIELKNHTIAKWSNSLNALAYYNMSKENYIKYYKNQFHNKKDKDIIEEACLNKLKFGLMDKAKFKELLNNSTDYWFTTTVRSKDGKKSIRIRTNERIEVLKLL